MYYIGILNEQISCERKIYMGRNKVDIHHEIKVALREMERFGSSKYDAKKSGEMKNYIYSYSTAKLYNRECQRFAEYVKDHSPTGRYTSLQDAFKYAKDYIEHENEKGKSAYTVKMERSAIAKLYGVEGKSLGDVRDRKRDEITRSRERTITSEKTGKQILNPSTRAGHFSENNNREIVNFCLGTGLRRFELEQLKGNQLHCKDGKYYLEINGKGGRIREVPIRSEYEKDIVQRCLERQDQNVWERVPSSMDVHHYRSQYATGLYNEYARPLNEIPKEDRYHCRGDLKGVCYDKQAMRIVTQALGHSRLSVIAEHYLR